MFSGFLFLSGCSRAVSLRAMNRNALVMEGPAPVIKVNSPHAHIASNALILYAIREFPITERILVKIA